jgi:hypothetical protein
VVTASLLGVRAETRGDESDDAQPPFVEFAEDCYQIATQGACVRGWNHVDLAAAADHRLE